MKDVKMRNKFVELRASGMSLRTIEKEIGIGRHTLAKWESECAEELEHRNGVELEALREKYRLTARARVERFGDQLMRVTEELTRRDLSTVSTPKLVELAIKLDSQLQDATPVLRIPSEAALTARREMQELLASLGPDDRSSQSVKKAGNGQVSAQDVVSLQIAVLQRYVAGEIDERGATTEMSLLSSIFKGIDIADLQPRLERLEVALAAASEGA